MKYLDDLIEYGGEPLQILIYSQLLSTLPFSLGCLLFVFTPNQFSFYPFFDDGEFILYSTSLLGTAFFLILKDYNYNNFPSRRFYMLLGLVILIAAITFYVIILLNETTGFRLKYDMNKFTLLTLLIYISSILFSFWIYFQDKRTTEADLKETNAETVRNLSRELDNIGDQS